MEYGALATDLRSCFDEKWVRRGGQGEQVLGSSDIQSLADLGSSYAMVREMRLVPFGLDDVTPLAGVAVVPLLPLLLTVMPLDQIVTRLAEDGLLTLQSDLRGITKRIEQLQSRSADLQYECGAQLKVSCSRTVGTGRRSVTGMHRTYADSKGQIKIFTADTAS